VDVAVAGAARLAAPAGRSGEPSRTRYTSLKGALKWGVEEDAGKQGDFGL